MYQTYVPSLNYLPTLPYHGSRFQIKLGTLTVNLADKREFIKISQAVGMGFVVMGVIGYVVKLSKSLPSC